jgi:predicted nucleotidyltransferase
MAPPVLLRQESVTDNPSEWQVECFNTESFMKLVVSCTGAYGLKAQG